MPFTDDIILGARQLDNPDGIAPRMDTEGPPPTRMPQGVKLQPIPTHSDAKMNVDNVDPAHTMEKPDMVREASTSSAGLSPMRDFGAPPSPDSIGNEQRVAPHMQADAGLGSLRESGLAGHALEQEGQARHAAALQGFTDDKKDLDIEMSHLTTHDPEFSNKLLFINAKQAALKKQEAQYKEDHPWGSMESAHPGFFGKLGHAFGQIGNVAGEALAPGLAQAIPGSHANLEMEKAQADQAIGESVKEQGTLAGAEAHGAAADLAQAKIPTEGTKQDLQSAQTDLANAKTGVVAQKPEIDAIHDLMAGNPEGGARINPLTGKQYTYAEAYGAAQSMGKPPQKPDSPEQQFIDDFQKSHPGSSMDEALRAYTAATTRPEKASTSNTRSDKSYQFQVGRLDKIRKPIDDLETRFSRLNDTMNQHNPQADALVAPELLTVMAGGQGSGLRMNEAEISRIVGGRSAWENLKGKIQHWSTNPDDARSITPDQDRQIRALMSAVNTKLMSKQKIINEANDRLINSEDPEEHRRIVAETQHHLDQVDSGGAGGSVRVQIPGHPPGSISQDKLEDFKKKYPNAQVLQ